MSAWLGRVTHLKVVEVTCQAGCGQNRHAAPSTLSTLLGQRPSPALIRESVAINSSLMTLARCLEVLRYNQMHTADQKVIPYRESKVGAALQAPRRAASQRLRNKALQEHACLATCLAQLDSCTGRAAPLKLAYVPALPSPHQVSSFRSVHVDHAHVQGHPDGPRALRAAGQRVAGGGRVQRDQEGAGGEGVRRAAARASSFITDRAVDGRRQRIFERTRRIQRRERSALTCSMRHWPRRSR